MFKIYKLIFAVSFFVNIINPSLQAREDEERIITNISSDSHFNKNDRWGNFEITLDDNSKFFTKDDYYTFIAIDTGWKVGDGVYIYKHMSTHAEDYWVTNLRTQGTILAWERIWAYNHGDDDGGQSWEGI